MPLRVYNTFTCEKETFVPLTPGKAGMYVCGVTVYDYCHIGHARANVVFDVIYRYLKHSGYDVTYVRNYTDIDDKIINRANQEGVDYRTIADRYIQSFDEDMARLGLELPSVQPKATEHIDGIIAIIQTLIDRGHAYVSGDDVYFAVETFAPYLRLSGRNLDEMQAGARVEVGEKKRHPMDFVLWKGSKPGEPWWESPWGNGRPGWHIECSAMSMKYLGTTFDFHGGGKDLVFPHHENEIAQSEAANGCQFVRYWLHNGFVNINSEKMSKSLGNFFTIREVLERFDPETLRFFILSAHYRSPIDFSDQNLEESQAGLERMYSCLAGFNELTAAMTATTGDNTFPLPEECRETQEQTATFSLRFREAMDDDFNTALAIGVLFELVRSVNRCVARMKEQPALVQASLVAAIRNCFNEARQVLGILTTEPKLWLEQVRARHAGQQGIDPAEIEGLIAERAAARSAKNFKRSDEIRDLLLEQGIQLLDSPQGTTWKAR